jgi:hypothetical protein
VPGLRSHRVRPCPDSRMISTPACDVIIREREPDEPPGFLPDDHADHRGAGPYGSFQSIGSPPSSSSSAFTRLNGFEPKKPFMADIGDGCTDFT